MFPTRLNLLPPDNKKYLQKMIFTEFTKSTLETVLFLLCLSGIALLCGQWVLQGYFNDLTVNIVSISSQQAESNAQIKKTNNILKLTQQIDREYVKWTPTLVAIANATPELVVLSNFSLNNGTKTITLGGTAGTRDSLLAFGQNLLALPMIESVNLPSSQLTEKENILFNFTAKLR
jgi:hypothetical protein